MPTGERIEYERGECLEIVSLPGSGRRISEDVHRKVRMHV